MRKTLWLALWLPAAGCFGAGANDLFACADGGYCNASGVPVGGTTGGGSSSGGSSQANGGGSSSGSSGGSSSGTSAKMPGAAVSPSGLDFGNVPCGAGAGPESVSVTATSAGSFSYTASLGEGAASPFAIKSGASGTVTERKPATIELVANPATNVPSLPASPGDTLTVTTSGAANDKTPLTVSLSETLQGAILAFNGPSLSFGSIPLGTQKSLPFTLVNGGNAGAEVTLSTQSPFTAEPAAAALPPGSGIDGGVTFSPTGPGTFSGTVSLLLDAGALCQPPPTLAVSGAGAAIALQPGALDFGLVPCGADAGPQGFMLTNAGTGPLDFSAQLQNGTAYTLACDTGTQSGPTWSGSLGPGAAAIFAVTPFPMPATSPVTPNLYADVVNLTTSSAGQAQVPISETAFGAILAFVPTSVSFGNVPVDTTSPGQPFAILNGGNADAGVFLSSPNPDFALFVAGANPVPLQSTTDVPLAAGGPQGFGAVFAPGSSTSAQSSTLVLTPDPNTILCAPLPSGSAALTLSGQGTNGSVAYSPSALSFGAVDCGAQAAAQAVTFTNDGNQAYTLSAALDAGTAYSVSVNPPDGTVAANGGSATITVTPLPIPQTSAVPGDYGDWLTVGTTVNDGDGGTVSVAIPLTESAQGAILANFAPASGQVLFPATAVGAQSTYGLYLENHGNLPATLAYSNVTPPQFALAPVTVPAGGNSSWDATFTPQAAQGYSGSADVGVASGTVLCQPIPNPPATIGFSGAGTNGATFYASTSLVAFGQVYCGSPAAAPQTVTLTNNGLAAVTWSAALGATSGGPDGGALFSIAPSSGSVPANGTGTITVTPAALTTALGKTGQVGTFLTVTDSASGSPIVITLGETAEGVVLSWNPGSFSFSSCKAAGTNQNDILSDTSGNQAVAVTLGISGDTNSELTFSANPISVAAGSTATETVTCTKALLTTSAPAETVTVTPSVPSGTPACAPLPGPFTITTP